MLRTATMASTTVCVLYSSKSGANKAHCWEPVNNQVHAHNQSLAASRGEAKGEAWRVRNGTKHNKGTDHREGQVAHASQEMHHARYRYGKGGYVVN